MIRPEMSDYLGDYELIRHLATGGMAEIWIARQSGPAGFDRELAIKRILPHLAREQRFISMFLDEARIASKLRHPNIVQIYELGEDDGEYFIVMEYIEGGDLADLLDHAEERATEIPIAMSVRIIADVLAALDYAHDFADEGKPLKIVHRDVSPHNVLIGRDGIIKLVDFGIAHAVERHAKTQTGMVKGKLSYMSPEQVEQEPLDRRADVFSAGCLLYELLTGRPPFGRELAAINGILNDDPADPRDVRPDIPEELVPIINRSLEKDPADRFQTALEMLEALEAVLRAFDKYVSPKQVARFAQRLTDGLSIEGYEDVSQAVPRAVSDRALAYAATEPGAATDDEAKLEVKISPAVRRAIEMSTPRRFVTPAPTREQPVEESPSERSSAWYAIPGLLLLVAAVGITAGALSGPEDSEVSATNAGTRTVEVASPAGAAPAVIELEEQYVDSEAGDGDGIYFDEEELHLVDLENWVGAMSADEVDRMLAINYQRPDAEYLWTVRAPALADEFAAEPERVNPGDPAAARLLGLEEIDVSAVESKEQPRRVTRRIRRPRRAASRRPPPAQETAEAAVRPATKPKAEPRRASSESTTPSRKESKSTKNDLRIIDRAVPY